MSRRCWHHFLTRVKEGDFCEKEGGRFGRKQKMHRVGIGRWSPSDGPGEYSAKMLISPIWYSADKELPMKSRKEKRVRTLRKSWWFGCNILSSLSFRESFLFSQVMFAMIGLDLIALGYIYISCKGPKKLDTHPIQQTLQFLCTFSATSPFLFFFLRVLSSWSRTPHIRVTWFAGEFSFYRVYLSFSYRAHRCGFIQIYSKVIEFN